MNSKRKNLVTLGALLVNSSDSSEWPKAVRKVIAKAQEEITEKISDRQYKLYQDAGGISIGHITDADDD